MSKSKIVIDKLAKILEQGMINSKDFSEELKSILRFTNKTQRQNFQKHLVMLRGMMTWW